MKKIKPVSVKNEEKIEEHFREILKLLGLDVSDPSIVDTPKRLAKMYFRELCGTQTGVLEFPKMTTFKNDYPSNDLVLERDIWFASMCEHHFLPIVGYCSIAYIPNKVVLGLSKFHRIVRYFASKPQIQERLSGEIGRCLQEILGTESVAVVINAKHFCCHVRGVRDPASSTINSFVQGAFTKPVLREELYKLLKL